MKLTASALVATSLFAPSASAYQSGIRFGLGRPVFRSKAPFSSMVQRRREMMDQMFDQQSMIDRAFRHLDREFELECPPNRRVSTLPYHITNSDELFSVTIDVPGVDPANIDVNVADDLLTLSGNRQGEALSYKFKKSFVLDSSVNVEKLSAKLDNGVLTVSAPKEVKKKEEKVKKIPVTAGKVEAEAESTSESVQEEKNDAKEEPGTVEDIIELDTTGEGSEETKDKASGNESTKDD